MLEYTDQNVKILEISYSMRHHIELTEQGNRANALWHAMINLQAVCIALGVKEGAVAELRLRQFLTHERADLFHSTSNRTQSKPPIVGSEVVPNHLFSCWALLDSADTITQWFDGLTLPAAPRGHASGK
jgi:hypothetical protein